MCSTNRNRTDQADIDRRTISWTGQLNWSDIVIVQHFRIASPSDRHDPPEDVVEEIREDGMSPIS
eukprot:2448670-Prorocentrum_lima.AAC.1